MEYQILNGPMWTPVVWVTAACLHVSQDSRWVKVITCSIFIWINVNFATFHSHFWNTIAIQPMPFSFPVLSSRNTPRHTESVVFYASDSRSLFWNKQSSIVRMKEKSENLIKRKRHEKGITVFHTLLQYFREGFINLFLLYTNTDGKWWHFVWGGLSPST